MTEEQTPHIAEKPKNRKYALEPKETSCGLHAQEVAGSSPAAPTTSQRLALFFGGLPRRLPCPRPIRSSTMIACSTFSRSVRRSASILLTSIAAMIAEFPGWEPSVLLATALCYTFGAGSGGCLGVRLFLQTKLAYSSGPQYSQCSHQRSEP